MTRVNPDKHPQTAPMQAVCEPRFTLDDAQAAADAWGFNCGPGALCAVLGMSAFQRATVNGGLLTAGRLTNEDRSRD